MHVAYLLSAEALYHQSATLISFKELERLNPRKFSLSPVFRFSFRPYAYLLNSSILALRELP